MMAKSTPTPLHGELAVPGDKSISHRAVMFGALSEGTTEITHFLQGADCLSTIDCFRKLGIEIEVTDERILVHGKGLHGLSAPSSVLDVGNSGTTMRLISGILSGQPFSVTLDGDASIRKRPMDRIRIPLSQMGAKITGTGEKTCAPLTIEGTRLHGIHYESPVASAQVKSAVLLAGLYADGETSVTEPALSRNHTELMLRSFGADIKSDGCTAAIKPSPKLTGPALQVPGDISSAAYFIAAGLCVPGSEIVLKNVGINPTRDGILEVARAMGGSVQLLNEKKDGEPTADLLISASLLHGTTIEGALIPRLIDEIPVICIMAAAAEGTTIIRDAAELRVKESDRIAVMTKQLTAMGADVTATDDGMIIQGGKPLHGATVDACDDHRVAMSLAIAALIAEGETTIKNRDCVRISYPTFYEDLQNLQQ